MYTREYLFMLFLSLDFVLKLRASNVGFPAGLMAECPGMNRTVTISPKTTRSLSVLAFDPTPQGFLFPASREKRCRLSAGGVSCVAKYLDLTKKTKVIISGYLDTSYSPIARSLTTQELERGHNVILLEIFPVLFRSYPLILFRLPRWCSATEMYAEAGLKGCDDVIKHRLRRFRCRVLQNEITKQIHDCCPEVRKFYYKRAARTTKPLGQLLGRFLASLTKKGLRAEDLEIVGGSLGAHIGFYASKVFTEITGELPARLTGLDPAGPCFRTLPPEERFNPSAAQRVDALHTNIDGFGIADPIAHVDFYANGGEYQPSMAGDFILPCFLVCSHMRAAFYWVSAYTNPDQFIAVRCPSLTHTRQGDCFQNSTLNVNYLGPDTNFNVQGIFYLPTTEVSPYFMGKKGLVKRDFNVNDYLLKTSPDSDIII